VEDPKVKQRFEEGGVVVVAGSPQEFGKEIADMYSQLKKVVADRKLVME